MYVIPFLLLGGGWGGVTQRHASLDTTLILKGIRNISMCDELPQITSRQHFHDIVAVLPHYHNVTAAA